MRSVLAFQTHFQEPTSVFSLKIQAEDSFLLLQSKTIYIKKTASMKREAKPKNECHSFPHQPQRDLQPGDQSVLPRQVYGTPVFYLVTFSSANQGSLREVQVTSTKRKPDRYNVQILCSLVECIYLNIGHKQVLTVKHVYKSKGSTFTWSLSSRAGTLQAVLKHQVGLFSSLRVPNKI